MNELDSELVMGQLRALGYGFTGERETADVVLYNTCSVRELAEQKVWSRLGEDQIRKKTRPGIVVGVLGCMAERDGADLIRRMPVVDLLVGPGELDKLPGLLDNAVRTRTALAEELRAEVDAAGQVPTGKLASTNLIALQGNASRRSATLAAAADSLEMLDLSRSIAPDDHAGSAYVRITRGCNKFCTYCVVPFTRGAEIHRPPEHIVDECKRLADAGVIEVTLLGQTVNHYRFEHGAAVSVGGVVQPQKGRSFTGGHARDAVSGERVTTFADLLAMIHERVPEIRRLRFVTSYPRDFGDDVLAVIRDHPRICRYLHVPAQSGSNRVLKMMNRGYEVEEYVAFVDRARAYLDRPDIGRPLTVAGDIIVGFPTETDEDYAATVRLLERVRYKNCFIFKYSPRPGTVAFDRLVDDVSEDVKRRRNNDLLAVQQRISAEVSREYVGRTLEVFVQGVSKRTEKRRAAQTDGGACSTTFGLTIGGRPIGAGASGGTGAATAAVEETPVPGEPVQMVARTDGDIIVHFDVPPGDGARTPASLIGKIVPVRIESAAPLALAGRLVDSAV